MPLVAVRLTAFESVCLDLLAHLSWSRGQVLRELLHEAACSKLRLTEEQRAKLKREFNVRRRPPNRRFDSKVLDRMRALGYDPGLFAPRVS